MRVLLIYSNYCSLSGQKISIIAPTTAKKNANESFGSRLLLVSQMIGLTKMNKKSHHFRAFLGLNISLFLFHKLDRNVAVVLLNE